MKKKISLSIVWTMVASSVLMLFAFFTAISWRQEVLQIRYLEEYIDQVLVTAQALANKHYDRKEYEFKLEQTIQFIPTRTNTLIFAIDATDGRMLGLSANNEQRVELQEGQTDAQRLQELKGLLDGEVHKLKINEKNVCIIVAEKSGIIFGVCVDSDEEWTSTLFYLVLMGSMLLVGTVAVIVVLIYRMNRSVIQDVVSLKEGIDQFLGGQREVHFSANGTPEMAQIAQSMNKMVNTYDQKSERTSQIISMMGNRVAVFEYLEDLHQVFYSRNMPGMFEMTPQQWEERLMSQIQEQEFNLNVDSGETHSQRHITESGRVVELQYTFSGNSCFGIAQDVSEQYENHKQLSEKLKQATEQAERDALTGLYNRQKSTLWINQWIEGQKKEGTMLLMDLDNFKRVNDEKGHPEGDLVLQITAKVLEESFGEEDVKARLGGDEFIVFMPYILSDEELQKKLNAFMDNCYKHLEPYYRNQQLSVSIGVAFVNDEIHNFDELYQCADAAMYAAKRQGKNRYYINEENNVCKGNTCNMCKGNCMRRRRLFND